MSERKGLMKFAEKLTQEENVVKRNLFYTFISFLCLVAVGLLLMIPISGYELDGNLFTLTALSWMNSSNINVISEDFIIIQVICFIAIIIMMVVLLFKIFSQLVNINKSKGMDKKIGGLTMTCVVFIVIYTLFSWIFPVINLSFGGSTFAKVNIIPLAVIILVTLYYSIVKGCMGTIKKEEFEESVFDEEEQESREILTSVLSGCRTELFIYSILSIVLSVLSVLSNILTITYQLKGTAGETEIAIVGWRLIFESSALESSAQRLIGYFAFVFFLLTIFVLFLVLISFCKKSRTFYKVAVSAIILGVSVCLLIGLLAQYFKIVQAVSLDFIADLIGDYVTDLDQFVTFEIKSASLLYFFGSCALLFLLFIRNPYTKALVLEQRIEDENAAKMTHSIEITGNEALPTEGGNGGGGELTLSTNSSSNDACPTFTELDEKYINFQIELEQRESELFVEPTLPKLVDFIVQYARDSRLHLYYTKEDIATFLAGLGTTKLSILQGMSGTGKTSLPKIVAEALYSVCDIVEVESSWRDKNELLGYYNEFNKVYTPKKFTQALYKAKLNSDVLTFIVLDEMNLSRVEYYFSDFLSLMEHEPDKREIKLVNIKLKKNDEEDSEYLGLEEGHTLKVPNNVWFIGTANRDESTYDISDKVYDRAYTMNFDKRAAKVQSYNNPMSHRYLPADTLNKLFDEAKETINFTIDNNSIIAAVEKLLAPYNISFGNRIAMQIESFVKIYLSCFNSTEKSVNEALEIILLSKVVRKLELKNIEDKDSLAQEFANLNLKKCSEFILNLKED